MQMYKPVFKENDLKVYESIKNQYLNSFSEKPLGNPRNAFSTCDNHLDGKQPFLFIDPKGNGSKEISWLEPKDINDFWKNQLKIAYFIVFFVSVFFFIIIYYFWGV